MKIRTLLAALGAAAALVSMPAQAYLYSAVYAFGDSLIDAGNASDGSGQPISQMVDRPAFPPSPPYALGRFTNGPTASELLAVRLGKPLKSYAVGGALSGDGNIDAPTGAGSASGLQMQVAQFLTDSGGTPVGDALFIVLGGSNDFLATLAGSSDPVSDIQGTASTVIMNLLTAVQTLWSGGARQFLLPLLPDIGSAPLVLSELGPDNFVSAAMLSINAMLLDEYQDLLPTLDGATFTYFDTFGAQRTLSPKFSNPGGACLNDIAFAVDPDNTQPCSDPENHFFWDTLHPSSAAHELLANELSALLVPEPGTLALAGLSIVAMWSRRRSVQRSARA